MSCLDGIGLQTNYPQEYVVGTEGAIKGDPRG